MSSINLSQYDDEFRAEGADSREFDSVPDGSYQVTVERVELTESQTSGNPMLKWTLRILAPRSVNRLLWRNTVINRNTLKYVKADLHLCGLELERLSDLQKNLGKLLDLKLDVTKKARGDYENVYFNRRIMAQSAMKPVKGLTGADDVPF